MSASRHTHVPPVQKKVASKTEKTEKQSPTPPTTKETPQKKSRTRSRKKSKRPQPTIPATQSTVHPTLSPLSPQKGQPLSMPLGRNMPAKMPLLDSIECARNLGYTTLQLFLGNPDRWRIPLLSPPLASSITQALSAGPFSPVVIHAPFIIDLSSERENIWINSVLLLRCTLDQARIIGASDVVVHLNNYKKPFAPISDRQIQRVTKGIMYSLSEGPGAPIASIRLLLENGCNPCFSPGSKIETLGSILHALPTAYQSRVQICLDTAHCWAAGYDLCSQMDQFLQLVERSIGFSHVRLLHLNDAKHALGSTEDEHAQWGKGQMSAGGINGIRSLLQDARLAHIALIMETPLEKNEQGEIDWEQEKQHLAHVKRILLSP